MWLVTALACRSPEVDTFLDDRRDAICARHAACGTLSDAGYDDEAACLDAIEANTGVLADQGGLSCETFDADAADTCLATYAAAPCDEPPELSICDGVCSL